MAFTIDDLLRQTDLGLSLAVGGPEVHRRTVAGAHAIEVERPTRWMPPGWLMLTNGLRLQRRAPEQRRLVTELIDHGVAGLGWATGTVFADIPHAILDEARRHDFPVLQVPFNTPFRDIVTVVSGAMVDGDNRALRRLQSIQDYLIDGMDAEDAEDELATRLATTLDADVVVVGANRRPITAVGRDLTDVLPSLPLSSTPRDTVQRVDADGRAGFVATAGEPNGERSRSLLVIPRSTVLDDRLLRPLLRRTVQLFVLVARTRHREDAAVRGRLSELTLAILDPETPAERRYVAAHELRTSGLNVDGPSRLVLATVTAETATETNAALETRAADLGLPLLTATVDEQLAAVLLGATEEHALAIAIAMTESGATSAGIAPETCGADQLAAALPAARDAAAYARTLPRTPPVARFEDLDAVSWLLTTADPDMRHAKLHAYLAPLAARPALLQTLAAYHAHDFNIPRTAAHLHLHPNSLRYRLSRIEAALGTSLDTPATIANLHIVLVGTGLAQAPSEPDTP